MTGRRTSVGGHFPRVTRVPFQGIMLEFSPLISLPASKTGRKS